MLLNDEQVAVNELIVAYRESIDRYEDAAAHVDEGTARFLDDVRATRERIVARLSEVIRASGELPRASDIERGQLHQLVTHAKAALASDERRVFLDDGIGSERKIETLLDDALAKDLAAKTRSYLETLRTRQREVLERLAGLATRPPDGA